MKELTQPRAAGCGWRVPQGEATGDGQRRGQRTTEIGPAAREANVSGTATEADRSRQLGLVAVS